MGRALWVSRVALLTAITSAACAPVPTPTEPAPPEPTASLVIEPVRQKDPLVIATGVVPPDPPVAAAQCELPVPARMPSDCRFVPALTVKATSSLGETPPKAAFDGSTCTVWNAGNFAPQSITVDLGTPTNIDAIVLVPEMTPNGRVRQRIELSDDGITFASAHRIEAPMASGAPVELVMPKRERARFMRVVSDVSPSWVAWREIGIVRCGP
jgi:hypothetical protein